MVSIGEFLQLLSPYVPRAMKPVEIWEQIKRKPKLMAVFQDMVPRAANRGFDRGYRCFLSVLRTYMGQQIGDYRLVPVGELVGIERGGELVTPQIEFLMELYPRFAGRALSTSEVYDLFTSSAERDAFCSLIRAGLSDVSLMRFAWVLRSCIGTRIGEETFSYSRFAGETNRRWLFVIIDR